MSIRYFETYRNQILDILSQEYVPSEVRNFETWRFKVLEGLSADPESLGTSIRQGRVYREEVLKALGVNDYTTDDIAYEDNWKEKVLEALNMEYTTEDIVNFEKWRAKVLEGLEEFVGGVYKTVSGMIVSIVDAKEAPIKSLTVSLQPKQSGSGDPSPSNVRPISGFDGVEVEQRGKNLLDPSAKVWLQDSNMKFYTQNGLLLNAGTYTLSYSGADSISGIYVNIYPSGSGNLTYVYNANKLTFTVTEPTRLYFDFYDARHKLVDDVSMYQLELGTTATAYEPYHGQSHSISFPSTVYGGSDEIVSGSGTETMKCVDLGSLNWGRYNQEGRTGYYFGVTPTGMPFPAKPTESASQLANILCSALKPSPSNDVYVSQIDYTIGIHTNGALIAQDSDYATASEFKQAMNGVQLCYELATPNDFQTTPTEINSYKGNNTLWSDGAVEVTYLADPRLTPEEPVGLMGVYRGGEE